MITPHSRPDVVAMPPLMSDCAVVLPAEILLVKPFVLEVWFLLVAMFVFRVWLAITERDTTIQIETSVMNSALVRDLTTIITTKTNNALGMAALRISVGMVVQAGKVESI